VSDLMNNIQEEKLQKIVKLIMSLQMSNISLVEYIIKEEI